jgi:putative methyltransferase (TIGR04325 family)
MATAVIKRLARGLVPPLLYDRLRRLVRRDEEPEWEHLPAAVPHAESPGVRGWGDQAVTQAYTQRWSRWVEQANSTSPLAYSIYDDQPILRYDVQHQHMLVAWVLSLGAGQRDRISVLDWGGGVGQLAVIARALRPDLTFEWVVHEVANTAAIGADLAPDVTFCTDRSCLDREYDVVIAKGSIQYAQDWAADVELLARAATRYVYVVETPFIEESPSYAMIQRPHWTWDTEYVGWAIRRSDFLAAAIRAGLDLEREVMADYRPVVEGAPEQPLYWGYVFRKRASERLRHDGQQRSS